MDRAEVGFGVKITRRKFDLCVTTGKSEVELLVQMGKVKLNSMVRWE
jgi:hypothetical protein